MRTWPPEGPRQDRRWERSPGSGRKLRRQRAGSRRGPAAGPLRALLPRPPGREWGGRGGEAPQGKQPPAPGHGCRPADPHLSRTSRAPCRPRPQHTASPLCLCRGFPGFLRSGFTQEFHFLRRGKSADLAEFRTVSSEHIQGSTGCHIAGCILFCSRENCVGETLFIANSCSLWFVTCRLGGRIRRLQLALCPR